MAGEGALAAFSDADAQALWSLGGRQRGALPSTWALKEPSHTPHRTCFHGSLDTENEQQRLFGTGCGRLSTCLFS